MAEVDGRVRVEIMTRKRGKREEREREWTDMLLVWYSDYSVVERERERLMGVGEKGNMNR